MNTLDSLPKSRIFILIFVLSFATLPGMFTLSAPITGAYHFATTRNCLAPAALLPEIGSTRVIVTPNQTPPQFTPLLQASTVTILRDNNTIIPDFTVEPAISYNFSAASLSPYPAKTLPINKRTTPGAPSYWFNCVALVTCSAMTDIKSNAFTPPIHPTHPACTLTFCTQSSRTRLLDLYPTAGFRSIIHNSRSVLSGVSNPDARGNPLKILQLISGFRKINQYYKLYSVQSKFNTL